MAEVWRENEAQLPLADLPLLACANMEMEAVMGLTLELSDEEATLLLAKAAAAGLSLEEWLRKLAQPEPPVSRPLEHIANIIVESMKDVPPEIMATMPKDGASQHDHYIYGWPKREV